MDDARHGTTIVTRTPLRISFTGGGTDLPSFFQKSWGAVFSTAIDKYVYVTVKRHSELFFDRPDRPGGVQGRFRLNYSKSEEVDSLEDIKNDIIRESLRLLDIDGPIYISTIGDVPASTGLGGSSAFAVGLLNALHAYKGERVSPGQLAEEACRVEIELIGGPIGKQDQYAAAFGGINVFCFKADGAVTVEEQHFTEAQRRELFSSMMLFWTGHQRDANGILQEQKDNTDSELERLCRMRDHARDMQEHVREGRLDAVLMGKLLDAGWQEKRKLASGISNSGIDTWYERAINAGAYGGKLCGAGGGGFLLFVVPPEHREDLRTALGDLKEVPFTYEARGSLAMQPFRN
jgi:D-glycero-alpha-D-manno-heptose-7-phosphate kinase